MPIMIFSSENLALAQKAKLGMLNVLTKLKTESEESCIADLIHCIQLKMQAINMDDN